jgi:hypothetical protein
VQPQAIFLSFAHARLLCCGILSLFSLDANFDEAATMTKLILSTRYVLFFFFFRLPRRAEERDPCMVKGKLHFGSHKTTYRPPF